ncbi:DDE-type integrase/transposase/recombinase [Nosocomiicoccus ampullae]|uniref:DDE-type integrase/transposase/recombinase n=1 Tax=Nosocomiicoccus ampullae TaxID=489910 RepID=UPI003C6E388F
MSFSISTSPTVRFVCISLEKAIEKLPIEHNLMIHTNQGFKYQHGNWTQLLEQNNIKQSMSRRGNCLDNSPIMIG